MIANLILLAHIAATWFMVGIIWLVQCVHYPLFDRVESSGFTQFESDHQAWIFPLVGPGMLVEALTAALLLWYRPSSIPLWLPLVGLALIAVNWISTALVQIPLHETLAQNGFQPDAHAKLVSSNWLRTAAWTLRGILALAMLLYPLSQTTPPPPAA
ncbi:hypothetical protein [Tuwongella immobilis]|uniref:DUF1772 domain-containing protein n=1 Tax=Tuwongella immobilis TaxID=692036 RepID=A0A6C2YQB1_9BACT|nr:hypothetical protein [Tuwongella immobilis]VIP03828.1 Uncharacterized protein OS=Rhodopirellula baltica WH47 GN=RBWH47_00038 PE=4 SV=1 [Tuwongella immobilis]VTS05023.1 Uncharacterized protein OS=Rhodopirellula baltica WH47 GN=RBWH47_00038 PE=4 SV=1 [Tuwongella immobilis]